MKFNSALLIAIGSLSLASGASAAVIVDGQDDLYNAVAGGFEGQAPVAIDVTGLSSITFAVSTGATVSLNSMGNFNDADGIGAAPSTSSNSGGNGISGISAPNAGYLTGAFEAATLGPVPAAIDFTVTGTSFSSLSPLIQQSFFIGDGLTGDGSGATQTFYVPTGATTLYLGISDACGYNGGPSCYNDNSGSFSVTATGTALTAAVPEPASWALMLAGFGVVGLAMRKRASRYSQSTTFA